LQKILNNAYLVRLVAIAWRQIVASLPFRHLGLTISSGQITDKKWNNYIEPYLLDLRISARHELLDFEILNRAYEATLKPLISLAASQGFIASWSYKISDSRQEVL
jgi:hypothetical protein